jgi:hypothetical protein
MNTVNRYRPYVVDQERPKRKQSLSRDEEHATKQKIQSLFHLSQSEAAVVLNISVHRFKHLCRSYGIMHWPHGLNEKSCSDNIASAISERYDARRNMFASNHRTQHNIYTSLQPLNDPHYESPEGYMLLLLTPYTQPPPPPPPTPSHKMIKFIPHSFSRRKRNTETTLNNV